MFLYSGTLGLKHRPELLYELAAQHAGDADVVVISEGMGEARLRELLAARPLPNLRVLPFQPFEQFPDLLGSADALVALLEPSAGTFSVPSKVLSYLCAGRPILAAIPPENLAARTIERSGSGLVVPPYIVGSSSGSRPKVLAKQPFSVVWMTPPVTPLMGAGLHASATTPSGTLRRGKM